MVKMAKREGLTDCGPLNPKALSPATILTIHCVYFVAVAPVARFIR